VTAWQENRDGGRQASQPCKRRLPNVKPNTRLQTLHTCPEQAEYRPLKLTVCCPFLTGSDRIWLELNIIIDRTDSSEQAVIQLRPKTDPYRHG
jgi:hypothetical protein